MKSGALSRERMVLLATIAALLVPLALLALYVLQRHQQAEAQLAQLEPRHARLLGVQAQHAEIDATLVRARELRTQYLYPASQDATQTGNVVQQRLRDIFTAAGLQVRSSQVLPAKEDKGFDRLTLTLSAEGDLLALQSALAVLSSQSPVIIVNDLEVRTQGGLNNNQPTVSPRLTAQFNLSVLRERS